ncbi:alanine racemase [Candidatus Uhrbacteria bacterium]|nr:alanine racemase [Candidatus Uhrbacteria bacterium]
MNPKTWIEVSESALRHNARAFLDLAGKAKVMAVVKSNAYGHGLVECSRILSKSGVHWFAVDHIDEALTLRLAGIRKPILVLGYTPNHRLVDAVKNNISLVAYNVETIKALGKGRGVAKIHLPIETGLTRDGIRLEDLSNMIELVGKYPNIQIEGTFLHFANIEDTKSRAYADHQLSVFKEAIAIFKEHKIDPKYKHTASSAASILYSDTHFNLLRVGIAMYGLWPSEHVRKAQSIKRKVSLEPVLSWKTIVAQVKRVKKGTPISYGLTERMRVDGKVAVLPIGYADGFDRVGMSRRAHVLICNKPCKVMGRVCMNMTMVDVTGLKNIRPESEVTLIGSQGKASISAEEMADLAGTINYEIVARLNSEIPRIVVK